MSKEQTDLLPEGYAETMPANWADVLRSRAEATYLDDTKGTRDLLTATAIYLSAASPSPAGGVQGVAGTDLCAAFEHEVTQQTQAYRFKAGSKPGTWLFACDEWIDLSAILSALTSTLSSQAQTTGGVDA